MTSRQSSGARLVCVAVQDSAPRALVSGAFHHLPARGLANLEEPMDADVLVCSTMRRPPRRPSTSSAAFRAVAESMRAPCQRPAAIEAFTRYSSASHPLALAREHPADRSAQRGSLISTHLA